MVDLLRSILSRLFDLCFLQKRFTQMQLISSIPLNEDGLKVRIIYLHFELTQELCLPASSHICSTVTSYGSVFICAT